MAELTRESVATLVASLRDTHATCDNGTHEGLHLEAADVLEAFNTPAAWAIEAACLEYVTARNLVIQQMADMTRQARLATNAQMAAWPRYTQAQEQLLTAAEQMAALVRVRA